MNFQSFLNTISISKFNTKVEKILKNSLDLIPSPLPSVKIQIMGGKGAKAKHCWMLSFEYKKFVNKAQQCFAFTPQANFSAHNLNFH